MMTLWVLVLLAVVAMNFSLSTRLGSASARNFKEDTEAYYLAAARVEEAMAYILTDKDPAVDFLDADGNFRTDAERPPVTGTTEDGGAEVTLKISDEESRLNINLQDEDNLLRLFEYVGITDQTAQELIDSLADWKDKDDLHRLSGAEDEYYSEQGYAAKNAFLNVPEELLLIKGFEARHFYGTDEAPGLEPLITTWGSLVNVNTASPAVLAIMGLDALDLDAVLMRRQAAEGGMRAVYPKLSGVAATRSSYFRIEARARKKGSPAGVTITSIVHRPPEGRALKVLYWKEGIESSGT